LKDSALSKKQLVYILCVAAVFIIWSGIFIWQSSGIAFDGKRYFILFDDAMIAMRYAWNFSHGNGLVWNTGERIEGFTTMSLTLLMSAITWITNNKSVSCLVMQIIGTVVMLLYAWTNIKISQKLFKPINLHSGNKHLANFHFWLPVFIFILSLSYYPLLYWSLLGMETGILALLISLIILRVFQEKAQPDFLLAALYGLAYYTRPDAAIPIAIFIIYRLWFLYRNYGFKNAFRSAILEGIILLSFVIAIHFFRYYYYGKLVPNTYQLKIVGMSLAFRIQNGFGFIKLFLKETIFLWPFIILALTFKPKKQAVLLVSLFIASILYQIWTGGDPWIFWRMMSPYVPLMFIIVLFTSYRVIKNLKPQIFIQNNDNHNIDRKLNRFLLPVIFFLLLPGLVIIKTNRRFLSVIAFKYAPYQTDSNRKNITIALALNELTTANATVAVLWGGTIPYYSKNLKAIDMLGKSDTYIASLPPDLNAPYNGMKSLVGHNKYDLKYSIIKLKPTYVQQFHWFHQDISEYGKENYVEVNWKGVKLNLLKNSPDVHWEKLK
jgi:arabinofuranosyltransferase